MPNTTDQPHGSSSNQFIIALICLASLLAYVFRSSFDPALLLFANDAPFGVISAQAGIAWTNFLGYWQDLNWLGSAPPSGVPGATSFLYVTLGPVAFAKFYVPLALLALGLSAWLLFRRLGFQPVVCLLGAGAALLSTDPFSYACWGLATLPLGMAATFLALAAIESSTSGRRWIRLVLAGLAVGLSIIETYDVGAIFSLFVAAFALFHALGEGAKLSTRFGRGVGRVALIAFCAAFMATQALETLIGTQVKGMVGMAQDAETKQRRWVEATQWSLPKKEALRLVIPGLFGYRMDTPEGGNYWGGVGRDLAWEAYLAQANPSVPSPTHPSGLRHSGAGCYLGVLVVLVAMWAVVQALRRKEGPFEPQERRLVLFWAGAALISLLLAFGRHAPFYQFFYALPYFSTIRNPIKFLHPLSLSLIILFGYGLHAMWRRHVLTASTPSLPLGPHLKNGWRALSRPDKRWMLGCLCALIVSVVGWMLYAAAQPDLVRHLRRAGFPEVPEMTGFAEAIARFSVGEVGWFVLFLFLSMAAVTLVLSGTLAGRRGRWAGLLLGLVLVVDLVRANVPWVVYYDYREKYASNPILELLRQKPFEQRVTSEVAPLTRQYMMHAPLYDEWLQRLFPYYNIQSLDIVQMPRTPELDAAYLATLRPANNTQLAKVGRLWQLTNTRLVLGPTQFLDAYNQQFDPLHKRFRPLTNFNVVAKADVPQGFPIEKVPVEKLTASFDPTGQYAVFEFTGALPRASLFTRWQVNTNDQEVLAHLADPTFDLAETVLVSSELAAAPSATTNASAGRVEFDHYEPKVVRLKTQCDEAAVLLLNDRYHPDWKVFVDGRPATLLRCNHIMRGVHLTPNAHTVEFRFEPPVRALYVSLAAVVVGLVLCGALAFNSRAASVVGTGPPPEPGARGEQKRRSR